MLVDYTLIKTIKTMNTSQFLIVSCAIASHVAAFHIQRTVLIDRGQSTFKSPSSLSPQNFRQINNFLRAKKKNDGESGGGMEDAFRQLEQLKSLGDDGVPPPDRKKQDDAFAKAMQELNLKDIIDDDDDAPVPLESEAALYKDMASELESTIESDLVNDVKNDLGGIPTTIPQFDPNTRDTEKFMEEALDQALEEAKKEAQTEISKDSLLDNKEIMKEIEKIFEKANDELLEGIEEMRKEQMELAKDSATVSAKKSQDRIDEEQARLAAAETNMKKMLEKVNQETKNVESAIEDLKKAQSDMEGGVDDKLIGIKSGGIIKQATLVGTLLFSLRSIVEGIAFFGGDPTHLMPAVIQLAIAVVCLIAFIFL